MKFIIITFVFIVSFSLTFIFHFLESLASLWKYLGMTTTTRAIGIFSKQLNHIFAPPFNCDCEVVPPDAPQILIHKSLADPGTILGVGFDVWFGVINILRQARIRHTCKNSPIQIHPSP